jgi:signal transduction histidine kinase
LSEQNQPLNLEEEHREHPPRFRGFALQFFLIAVLPLTALLLIVVFGSQALHNQAMRNLVGDRDLKTVRAASSSIERELIHMSSTVEIISRSLAEKTDLSGLILSPEEILSIFDSGAAILSDSGKVISVLSNSVDWQATAPQILNTLRSQKLDLTHPAFVVPDAPTNDPAPHIFVAMNLSSGKILVTAFTLKRVIESTIGDLVISGESSVLMVGPGSGNVKYVLLYQGGGFSPSDTSSTHPGIEESLNGESGINYFKIGKNEHVVAYTSISPTGWGLVIEESWEDIVNPYLSSTQSAPLVIVPAFLLAMVAIWFGVQRIVTPLHKLEGYAANLARGDFDSIHLPVGGIEEIRNLQSELIEMADKLKVAQMNLRSYIGAITAGIENERRSLARELHDDTIQSLIALNQRLQLLELNPAQGRKKSVTEIQELVQQTMVNLRRMIRGLRPIYLEDLGLVSAVEMLVTETGHLTKIPIGFSFVGDEQRLKSQTEMSLYRMVQESLNNIVHHSDATQASVSLEFTSGELIIRIQDNGKGFQVPANPAEFPERGHFGLLGLQERAEIIKADLLIESAPGRGTDIMIRVKME